MAKTRITFVKAWHLYNANETAGFDAKVAADHIAAGRAVPFDPDATKNADGVIGQALTLAARKADLDAREAALAEREAAADGAGGKPASDAKPGSDAKAAPAKKAEAAEKGEPPRQGVSA